MYCNPVPLPEAEIDFLRKAVNKVICCGTGETCKGFQRAASSDSSTNNKRNGNSQQMRDFQRGETPKGNEVAPDNSSANYFIEDAITTLSSPRPSALTLESVNGTVVLVDAST